jgi:hypothetical protein
MLCALHHRHAVPFHPINHNAMLRAKKRKDIWAANLHVTKKLIIQLPPAGGTEPVILQKSKNNDSFTGSLNDLEEGGLILEPAIEDVEETEPTPEVQ